METLIMLLVILIIRTIELRLFLKNHKSKWSAFRFLFMEGPSVSSMFFSLKPLTIKRQYDKRVVDKLNEYALA